ncbi:hypothetical protein B0H11DRAFT_1900115 [Mycena galericulata]|nr:hypothetical protein B0H11DRAFT_1900115 [Mycena galericulata]
MCTYRFSNKYMYTGGIWAMVQVLCLLTLNFMSRSDTRHEDTGAGGRIFPPRDILLGIRPFENSIRIIFDPGSFHPHYFPQYHRQRLANLRHAYVELHKSHELYDKGQKTHALRHFH